jgi:hypothetical protein
MHTLEISRERKSTSGVGNPYAPITPPCKVHVYLYTDCIPHTGRTCTCTCMYGNSLHMQVSCTTNNTFTCKYKLAWLGNGPPPQTAHICLHTTCIHPIHPVSEPMTPSPESMSKTITQTHATSLISWTRRHAPRTYVGECVYIHVHCIMYVHETSEKGYRAYYSTGYIHIQRQKA